MKGIVNIPNFTTDLEEANDTFLQEFGECIYLRNDKSYYMPHGNKNLSNLYTTYINSKDEFYVQVENDTIGKVFIKNISNGWETNEVNKHIRNINGGYIEELVDKEKVPQEVLVQALLASKVLYNGYVRVAWNVFSKKAFVLRVNK